MKRTEGKDTAFFDHRRSDDDTVDCLISNTPPMFVGATHYGYPFAWPIQLVLAPQYYTRRVNALHSVADIIIWAVIIGIVLLILARTRKAASR